MVSKRNLLLLLAGIVASILVAYAATADKGLTARNLPEDGKVLFIMGQDSETLTAYKASVLDNDTEMPFPGGVTLYTNITFDIGPGVLAGLEEDADWGGGITNFKQTLEQFPDAALAVGLALSDEDHGCNNLPLRSIAADKDDEEIQDAVPKYHAAVDRMIEHFKALERPVYLRIAYEFDGLWNCYQVKPFKQAFRYIKSRIDALGADNIATVWQSAAYPNNPSDQSPIYDASKEGHLDEWYPGDDVVDWVGLSAFYGTTYDQYQWSCDDLNPQWFTASVSPRALQDRIVAFAREHKKPAMISEAAPQAFRIDEPPSASCIFKNDSVQITSAQLWDVWYSDFFGFIHENRDIVRAVAYINTDWQSQDMWQCEDNALAGGDNCPKAYWGDSRIQGNPLVLSRFKAEILNNDIYVQPGRPASAGQLAQLSE